MSDNLWKPGELIRSCKKKCIDDRSFNLFVRFMEVITLIGDAHSCLCYHCKRFDSQEICSIGQWECGIITSEVFSFLTTSDDSGCHPQLRNTINSELPSPSILFLQIKDCLGKLILWYSECGANSENPGHQSNRSLECNWLDFCVA